MDQHQLNRIETRFQELESFREKSHGDIKEVKSTLGTTLQTLSEVKALKESVQSGLVKLERATSAIGSEQKDLDVKVERRLMSLELFQEIQEKKNKDFLYYIGFRDHPWTKKRVAYLTAWAIGLSLYVAGTAATAAWIFAKMVK